MGIYECRIFNLETHLDDSYLVKARSKRTAREAAFERIENEVGTPRRDIEIYSVRKIKSVHSGVWRFMLNSIRAATKRKQTGKGCRF